MNILAACLVEPGIFGVTGATILNPENLYTLISPSNSLRDQRGFVLGPIVYNNQLNVIVCLR